jgi:hypothetical protein
MSASIADAYVLAGIKHAAGGDGAAPSATRPDTIFRGLEFSKIRPSSDGKTRSLSLTKDDGFELNLQLPTDKLEDYTKKGRASLLKHVREALDHFLKQYEDEAKAATAAD